MANSFDAYFENFDANGPSSAQIVQAVEVHFGCTLPADYKSFISVHDGGEGFVGDQYLILWKAGELIDFNRDYETATYAPGLLLFGSNGGGEAFAFDTRPAEEMRVRMVPFVGMSLNDATPVASTFEGLLTRLGQSHETLP